MSERNNSAIKKPVVINTDLGAVRNEIALKDTTVRPDATIWANNPTAANNAQRIAQAFRMIGNGLQDMAKGELDEARMDYTERKQAEAEAKQAAREAKADARIAEAEARQQRTADAKLQLLKMRPQMLKDSRAKYTALASADDFDPEQYHNMISSDIEAQTQGASKEHLEVFYSTLFEMETTAVNLGTNRIKADTDKHTVSDILSVVRSKEIDVADFGESLSIAKNQFIATGRSSAEFNDLLNQSVLAETQLAAKNGEVDEIARISEQLFKSDALADNETQQLALRNVFATAMGQAEEAKKKQVQVAAENALKAAYKENDGVRDNDILRKKLKETEAMETNGDLELIAVKNATTGFLNQRINTNDHLDGEYKPLLTAVRSRIIDAVRPSQAKGGSATAGQKGVVGVFGANDNYIMQTADIDEVMNRISDRVINYAIKNRLPADSADLRRALYHIQAEETGKWNIGNLNPDSIIDREFKDLDIHYFDEHAEALKSKFYIDYKNAQAKNQNFSIFIDQKIPLTGDAERDKELKHIRNSLCFAAQMRELKERETRATKAMKEEDIANQSSFFVTREELIRQKEQLRNMGLGGWDEVPEDLNEPNLLSQGWTWLKENISVEYDEPPKYHFQYDVPYSLDDIDAAEQIIKEESEGKRSLKNMSLSEATREIERLKVDKKIEAAKQRAQLAAEKFINNHLSEKNKNLKESNNTLGKQLETAEEVIINTNMTPLTLPEEKSGILFDALGLGVD